MKKGRYTIALIGVLSLTLVERAQSGDSFELVSFVLAGGGGSSSNETFTVMGTFGQAEAESKSSSEHFSIESGFWNTINVIQSPSGPQLRVRLEGVLVVVDWPASGSEGFAVQCATDVTGPWFKLEYQPGIENGRAVLPILPFNSDIFIRLIKIGDQ